MEYERNIKYDCFECNGQQDYYNTKCDYLPKGTPDMICLWKQVANNDEKKIKVGDSNTTLDDVLGYHLRLKEVHS